MTVQRVNEASGTEFETPSDLEDSIPGRPAAVMYGDEEEEEGKEERGLEEEERRGVGKDGSRRSDREGRGSSLASRFTPDQLQRGYTSTHSVGGFRSCLRLDGQWAIDSSLATPLTTFKLSAPAGCQLRDK